MDFFLLRPDTGGERRRRPTGLRRRGAVLRRRLHRSAGVDARRRPERQPRLPALLRQAARLQTGASRACPLSFSLGPGKHPKAVFSLDDLGFNPSLTLSCAAGVLQHSRSYPSFALGP